MSKVESTQSIRELSKKLYPICAEMYSSNDSAHKISHANKVVAFGELLAKFRGYRFESKTMLEVVAACWLHDVMADDRDHHHAKAYGFVRSDSRVVAILESFGLDVERVALATLEHRASFTGGYSSEVSEIVSAADRGEVGKDYLDSIILRSYKYHMENDNEGHQAAVVDVARHMIEKYGIDGYVNFPNVWVEYHNIYKDVNITDLREWLVKGNYLDIIDKVKEVVSK